MEAHRKGGGRLYARRRVRLLDRREGGAALLLRDVRRGVLSDLCGRQVRQERRRCQVSMAQLHGILRTTTRGRIDRSHIFRRWQS